MKKASTRAESGRPSSNDQQAPAPHKGGGKPERKKMNVENAEYFPGANKVVCGDFEITLDGQASQKYIDTPWRHDTVEDGEEYVVGYEARGTGDDGEEYAVEWRFWVVKGEEPEEDSLPWHLAENIHAIAKQ